MAIVQKHCGLCDTTTFVSSEQHACAVCGEPLREVSELHRSMTNVHEGHPLHGDFVEMRGVDGSVLISRKVG